jgi:4-hydroxy-tetrahydrodipicolinate synthase
VLPVVQMPYDDNFEIDYATLGALVDWLYAHGADGIVLALASELLRLTAAERVRLGTFLVETSRGRGSVTLSVGAESAYTAAEYARRAADAGADALMAIPPLSVAVGEDALRAYYGAILAAVDLPIVVQDASGYVGRPMSTAFMAALLNEAPERILFKPEAAPVGPVITALSAATNGRARIFEGSGGLFLTESHRRGIAGTMPGSDLIDGIVALWRALEAGDEERVYALSPLIGTIVTLGVGLDGYLAIEKHLLVRRGVFKNALVRGPVGFALDAPATAEVDRLFDRLQFQLRAQ